MSKVKPLIIITGRWHVVDMCGEVHTPDEPLVRFYRNTCIATAKRDFQDYLLTDAKVVFYAEYLDGEIEEIGCVAETIISIAVGQGGRIEAARHYDTYFEGVQAASCT